MTFSPYFVTWSTHIYFMCPFLLFYQQTFSLLLILNLLHIFITKTWLMSFYMNKILLRFNLITKDFNFLKCKVVHLIQCQWILTLKDGAQKPNMNKTTCKGELTSNLHHHTWISFSQNLRWFLWKYLNDLLESHHLTKSGSSYCFRCNLFVKVFVMHIAPILPKGRQ